jgi:hypothetical protein
MAQSQASQLQAIAEWHAEVYFGRLIPVYKYRRSWMHKGKQLIVAMLVLGVLIGAALLVWRDPFERGARPDYSALLPARSEGTIDRITVTTKEGSISAEKRGDTWWIVQPRELAADDGQLKAAAASLEKIAVVDTASKKQERHAEYGLAKDNPERIEVRASAAGKEALNFATGKLTPDGAGVFIVLANDPNTVYTTSWALPSIFNAGIKEWRSKMVLNLPRESIDRIQVVNGQGTFDVEKISGDQWRKKDDPNWPVDAVRFGQVVGAFSRLPWVEIVDEPQLVVDYGFNTPQAKVTVTAGGKDTTLIFGKDVEGSTGNSWLKIGDDPKVYQVRKGILDRVTRDFDYYRGEAPKPEQEEPKKTN